MQLTTSQAIYLAGLVHDIGKFWQRATKRKETLSIQTRNLETHICPTNQHGRTTHKHALWTSEFFETFANVMPQRFIYKGEQQSLSDLSARHHKWVNEQNELERIIAYADKLSSGQDRRGDLEAMDMKQGEKQYPFKKIPLQSIFDNLYGLKGSDERSWHHLQPLSNDETVFAEGRSVLKRDLQTDYEILWESFAKEVKSLPTTSFVAFSSTLLALLEKYTWCIPSSTIDQPDVSLFDHLKTTGAIARCLYDSVEIYGKLPQTFDGLKQEDKERFILLAGDFSGIQSFIYQITSKGAAKTLKGRSFYLQLITDVVLTKILKIFGLDKGHILLSSGGGFQLLLPNDTDKIDRALSLIDDINIEMRGDYDSKLYIAAAALPFVPNRLVDKKGYTQLTKEAQQMLEVEKDQRYARRIDPAFFSPQPLKGTTADDVCKVTGLDLSDEQKVYTKWLEGEGAVSRTVDQQIRLGQALRNAAVLLKYEGRNAKRSDEFSPFNRNITYTFLTNKDVEKGLLHKLLKQPQLRKIIWLNNPDQYLDESNADATYASSYSFYGAAWTPSKVGKNNDQEVADFTDIAFDGNRNNDLGILRMDVDNLGKAFMDGFNYETKDVDNGKEIRASISRISTLSRMMNWFFGGYLHHIITEKITFAQSMNAISDEVSGQTRAHEICNHILPVYAGGDDLFLVTRWDIAPMIAQQICHDFKIFTSAKMTISGGIAITPDKYPIHKGAQEAGQAEGKAKEWGLDEPDSNQKKNAICYLNQPLGWDDFDLTVEQVIEIIQLQTKMGNRSLTGFLRRLTGDFILEDCNLYGKWRWRAAYQLKRMNQKNNEDISSGLIHLGSSIFTGTINGAKFKRTKNKELIDVIPMITRWVQNLTRKA